MDGLSRPIEITPQAIVLAQRLHDAFERRILDQLGYPPRLWDALHGEEHRIRAEAAQELIDRGLLLAMPDCSHPREARLLTRREMVVCTACGVPVSLLERISEGVIEP